MKSNANIQTTLQAVKPKPIQAKQVSTNLTLSKATQKQSQSEAT